MKSPNTKWLDKAKSRLYLTVLLGCVYSLFSALVPFTKFSQQSDNLAQQLRLDTLPEKKKMGNKIALLINELLVGANTQNPMVSKTMIPVKKRASIWNEKAVNLANQDDISLFVFEGNHRIDTVLTRRIKAEFYRKNYNITPPIIYEDQITPLIADKLKKGQLDYFRGNLYRLTDYVCIAISNYTYAKNYYRSDLVDCTLRIEYYIYSASTGVVMFSEQDKIVATGINQKMAKFTAIQNFVL